MNPTAGWYADPENPQRLRWWNGEQWTGDVHDPAAAAQAAQQAAVPEQWQPAAAQPAQQWPEQTAQIHRTEYAPTPAKKRGRGVLFALIGGIAAVAVAATIAVVSISGGGAKGEPRLVGDYLFLAPKELPHNAERLIVPSKKSLAELTVLAGNDPLESPSDTIGKDFPGVIEIYSDSALQNPVKGFYYDNNDGKGIVVKPIEIGRIPGASTRGRETLGDKYEVELRRDVNEMWKSYSRYYIVSYFDENGEKLEHPEVRTVWKKPELAPITPVLLQGEKAGTFALDWEDIEGADEYWIVKRQWWQSESMFAGQESMALIDIVKTSEWDSSTTSEFKDYLSDEFGDQSDQVQNDGLQAFARGESYDELKYNAFTLGDRRNSTEGLALAVIAVNTEKSLRSPANFIDVIDTVGMLPNEIAFNQLRETDHLQSVAGDLSDIPTWLPVTVLDGSTVQFPAEIDQSSLKAKVSFGKVGVSMTLRMRDSLLTSSIFLPMPDGADPAAFAAQSRAYVDAFNERSRAEAPQTGGTVLQARERDGKGLAVGDSKVTTELPKIPFEVVGSNEFVRYLATHMAGRTSSVEIQDFIDQPGQIEPQHAVLEALNQNPYIFGQVNWGFGTISGRAVVHFYYSTSAKEANVEIAKLQQAAKDAVAELELDGKSDIEKARAINNWIIDRTVYDYGALAKIESRDPTIWQSTSIDPRGILLGSGTSVCSGYSAAFVVLAREAGLEAIYVSGNVTAVNGSHAWNRVKLDGKWVSLDTTWNDDDNGNPRNRYLFIDEPSGYTGPAERTVNDQWIAPQFQNQYATR